MPLLTVQGRFYRAIVAERVGDVLAPPDPESAGRYHRPGQPALYIAASAEWAWIAVSGYMREDGLPRVIVPLQIGDAHLLDQRDEAACASLGIDRDASNASWRSVLASGGEPSSWRNADAVRAIGADGIVDRSRQIPGGWHVTLFRWNALGGPIVKICGEAVPAIRLNSHEKWG